ncbi:MAG: hypothetical protein U0167_15025 [bacterium]
MSMRSNRRVTLPCGIAMACALAASASSVRAQAQPAAGSPPPDDTPSVKVGGTIYTDYTFLMDPKVTVEGLEIRPNSFNVSRSYINVTGNLSHRFAFRITPDIARESGAGSSLNGSYTFRLKYALGQLNLDEWVTKGSWVRLGLQQTPYIDYIEGIYRYRFQGTTFEDREGKITASDNGVSAHVNLEGDYGDVHVGVYNGEGYAKPEANDQKAFQGRVSVRPAPQGPLHGLRLTAFADVDHYASGDSKMRWIGNATFENPHVNAGFDLLGATDQTAVTAAEVKSQGFSVWATPRTSCGWEALLRYDELKPDKDQDGKKKTSIGGVAYWFPLQKGVAGAVMVDYQQVEYSDIAVAKAKQIALHALLNF